MNVSEMHLQFKISLDKIDSEAYSEILPEEIDIYLNNAELDLIKLRYGLNNIYHKGFEQNQKRVDDLKNLVVSNFCETVKLDLIDDYNLFEVKLDSLYLDEVHENESSFEYMFFIKGLAKVNYKSCSGYKKGIQVQQDDITSIALDPFNRPKANEPNFYFENGNIYLWCSQDSSSDNFLLTFIRKPLGINLEEDISSELPEYMHNEIVQLACDRVLEDLESPRVNSHQKQLNIE